MFNVECLMLNVMRVMKKTYQTTKMEIVRINPTGLMIPTSDPGEPHLVPKGHYVPGPGASYAPPANILK